jgi:hypothetical protein
VNFYFYFCFWGEICPFLLGPKDWQMFFEKQISANSTEFFLLLG